METFPRYWPFVWGIPRSTVNSPHKSQWHGALMFSLNCVWINGWVNNCEAGDLGRYRSHYNVTVMSRHRTVLTIPSRRICYTVWSVTACIQSLEKVWRSDYWKFDIHQALPHHFFFRFCSYLCCLSMGDSNNFRLCFELQNVTAGQNNIAPRIRSWCDEAKNIIDCSYFFSFEGCMIATQIH